MKIFSNCIMLFFLVVVALLKANGEWWAWLFSIHPHPSVRFPSLGCCFSYSVADWVNRILDCHGNLETVFPRKMTASVFSASSLKQNLLIFKGQNLQAAVGWPDEEMRWDCWRVIDLFQTLSLHLLCPTSSQCWYLGTHLTRCILEGTNTVFWG